MERIAGHVRSTYRPEVLGDIGGFGGLVAVPAGYDDPVLVSSTDGVGTKLKVAEAAGRFDTIGIDLVAMCVDDVAVQGADPLFFLDYVGVGRLDPGGGRGRSWPAWPRAAARPAAPWWAARWPSTATATRWTWPASASASASRGALMTGAAVAPGDVLVGLASPGLRSNGYSLARRCWWPGPSARDPAWDGADVSLVDELLRPSVIYSPPMAALRRAVAVHGFAHITGGGLPGNLVRVLPAGVRRGRAAGLVAGAARSSPRSQRRGEIPDDEMARVFNLGIGMVAVVAPEDVAAARRRPGRRLRDR